MNAVTQEAVRLLVWDLDETFWDGTLTEGGIAYRRDFHDIVIQLAQRGIVSSICSKNEHDRVREILEREGIWDYFVFPSINWDPKGPRLAALVEAVQLRAPTVMFIDDNPMNLAEAQHYVPGLQVADETFIARLLDNPLFKGKPDPELSRLKQYRLLERRKADEAQAGGDNAGFLRESNIVVTIEHDLAPHTDRAIELINRTNQLNFTKRRLPENLEEARRELKDLLGSHRVQAGIVRVQDRYGDYGYCGLYVMDNHIASGQHLLHFCFSCRILNMGVETWLYRHLGKPGLRVSGEVLTDVAGDTRDIDWIRLVLPGAMEAAGATAHPLDSVFLRGGCDMRAIAHYCAMVADEVVEEFNLIRNGSPILACHSTMALHALRGAPAGLIADCAPLDFLPEDFSSFIGHAEPGRRSVWVLSFSNEYGAPLFRHRATGALVPIRLAGVRKAALDVTACDPSESGADPDAVRHLRQHFDYIGLTPDPMLRENISAILGQAPPDTPVYILLGDTRAVDPNGRVIEKKVLKHRNDIVIEAAQGFPHVGLLDIRRFETEDTAARPRKFNHFDRMVYFRVFQHIMAEISA